MLVPLRILLMIALFVWGTAFFELYCDPQIDRAAFAELDKVETFVRPSSDRNFTADQAIFWGFALGIVVFGHLIDRFGRFRLLLWCLVLTPVFAGLSGLAFTAFHFLLFRTLVGAAASGLLLSGGLLLIEHRNINFRCAATVWLPAAGVVGVMLTMLLWGFVRYCPFLLFTDWRNYFVLAAIPASAAWYFRRYQDEPHRWKIAVRDAQNTENNEFSAVEHRSSIKRLAAKRNFRAVVFGTIMLFGGLFGLFGSMEITAERLRSAIRFDNVHNNRFESDMKSDAVLVGFLYRYPQLFSTKKFEAIDFSVVSEKLLRNKFGERSLSGFLFDGLLKLQKENRPVQQQAVIDAAFDRWNVRYGDGTKTSEVPLEKIEAFSIQAEEYLEWAIKMCENDPAIFESDEAMSRTDRWNKRGEILKTLLDDLQQRYENRVALENRQFRAFLLRFCFGGIFGVAVFQGLRRLSNNGVAFLVFLAFASLVTLYLDSFLNGVKVSKSNIYYYVIFLGFVLLPILSGYVSMLPKLFPPSFRGTGIGLCTTVALLTIGAVFQLSSNFEKSALLPYCFLATVPCILVLTFFPLSMIRGNSEPRQ